MKRTRDQDLTTSVISLGFLANTLELLLSAGQGESLPVRVDSSVFRQWELVLQETIDFIQAPRVDNAATQTRKARFLSRAPYLEQIYTATPQDNRRSLDELASYLRSISDGIAKLSSKEPIEDSERKVLLYGVCQIGG